MEPVRPVLKRSVNVPSQHGPQGAIHGGSVAACPGGGHCGLDRRRRLARAGPGPYHARNVRVDRREEEALSRVAIFTDSASDLDPAEAAAEGITIVPLLVNFGAETFKAGVDLSAEAFWERMVAPDAPFPTTAASSPGEFKEAYEAAFADGAEAIVSVHVAGTLSGTIKSAQIARDMLPDREIHVVDSLGASMAQGILARMGDRAWPPTAGPRPRSPRSSSGARPTCGCTWPSRRSSTSRRAGGSRGAQAAIGTLLSVKPIIAVKHGVVETADRVRTRAKARERVIDLICQRPIERLAILHTVTPDVEGFRDEVLARAPGGLDPADVSIDLVGASVGPHLGPGCVGAAVLYRA